MESYKDYQWNKKNLKTPKEIKLLKQVCKKAKKKTKISNNDLSQLSNALGSRFNKAWNTIKEKRVKKYVFYPSKRIIWIVVGREREYQIMPAANFCSCDDFYFRVIDKETNICYHLIAQKIAGAFELFDEIEEEDGLYNCLMEEWKKATA
jgi:predicted nucleic acid-binding Zn finger protein